MSEIRFPNGSVVKFSTSYEIPPENVQAAEQTLALFNQGKAEVIRMQEDPNYFCMECDEESEVVGHGIHDGQVYDEPRCARHYNISKRNHACK